MNALAKLRAAVNRNPDFDWRDAKITAAEFDAEYWMRWAMEVGLTIIPWGTGYGVGEERGRLGSSIKANAALAALRNGRGGTAKERKLIAYLAKHVPAHYESINLDIAARRTLAEHAHNLPCVAYSEFHVSSSIIIPHYLFFAEDLEGMGHPPAFIAEKTEALKKRRDEWEREVRTATGDRAETLNAATAAYQNAMRMFAQSLALEPTAKKQAKALRTSIAPSRKQKTGNRPMKRAA